MAHITLPYVDEPFMVAIKHTLEEDTRKNLKEQLMPLAEQYVDAAVEAAMVPLKVKIEAWVDHFGDERHIEITTKHERADDQKT